MDIKLTIGERLQDLMKESGITQRELSKELKISAGKMNDIINDSEKDIGYRVFIKIAKYFNVSTDYLLGLTDVKSPDTNIQSVCKFTGLSEGAIFRLHKFSILDFDKVGEIENCFASFKHLSEFVNFVDSVICDSTLLGGLTSFFHQKSVIIKKELDTDKIPIQVYRALLEYDFDEKLCKKTFNNFNELYEQIYLICDEVTESYQEKLKFKNDVEFAAEQFELSYGIVEYEIHKMITDFLKKKYLGIESDYLESLKRCKSDWIAKYNNIIAKYGDNND